MVAAIKISVVDQAAPKAVVITEVNKPVVIQVGLQGPPGPPGVGVADVYIHTQASASDLWVINHNLGHRPIVELYTVGGVVMEATIVHINANQVQAQFATPMNGFATLL